MLESELTVMYRLVTAELIQAWVLTAAWLPNEAIEIIVQ